MASPERFASLQKVDPAMLTDAAFPWQDAIRQNMTGWLADVHGLVPVSDIDVEPAINVMTGELDVDAEGWATVRTECFTGPVEG